MSILIGIVSLLAIITLSLLIMLVIMITTGAGRDTKDDFTITNSELWFWRLSLPILWAIVIMVGMIWIF